MEKFNQHSGESKTFPMTYEEAEDSIKNGHLWSSNLSSAQGLVRYANDPDVSSAFKELCHELLSGPQTADKNNNSGFYERNACGNAIACILSGKETADIDTKIKRFSESPDTIQVALKLALLKGKIEVYCAKNSIELDAVVNNSPKSQHS